MGMQTNDRNLLLHKYYKFVQQYTTQQVKILDFLTRRVRWETSQLEVKQQEAAKYHEYYGPNGEMESRRTIERHRMRMQEDQHALTFLEAEINKTLTKAFAAAFQEGPPGVQRDNKPFYDLYMALQTEAMVFKIDLGKYVQFPSPVQSKAQGAPPLDGARNQPLQIISDNNKHSLAGGQQAAGPDGRLGKPWTQGHVAQSGYPSMSAQHHQMVVPQAEEMLLQGQPTAGQARQQAQHLPTDPNPGGPRPSKPPVTSLPRAQPQAPATEAHKVTAQPQYGTPATHGGQPRQQSWSSRARTNGRGRGRGFQI